MFVNIFVFFFKQKTAYEMRISDWSSDGCSSDLRRPPVQHARAARQAARLSSKAEWLSIARGRLPSAADSVMSDDSAAHALGARRSLRLVIPRMRPGRDRKRVV